MLTAVSAQRLPAGATAYKYELPDGTSFENLAPPSGFNAATASNATLAELNMPLRPAGATAMKTWAAQVAPYTRSSISRSETFCALPSTPEPAASATAAKPSVAASPLASVGHSGSTSFSGYELRSGPYGRAVGHFVQPATGTDVRSMSTWIGLNSSSNGRLIQAGAGNEAGYGGSPFWEEYCSGGSADYCNGPVIDDSVSARPGDTVSVNVAYNKSANMSYYQVAINGALDINASRAVKDGGTSGSVVDFWTERTGGDQIPTSKAIVFSALRTYASYTTSTAVPFGSQNYFATEMTTDGNFYSPPCTNTHILMYPANVSSEGFVNNYCRST